MAAILAAGLWPAAAAAGPDGGWFLHPFGELRAYHRDWLAVCDDAGAGPCRAVQIRLEGAETRVGPARIAVLRRDDGGGHAIELFMRGMAGPHDREPVVLVVDDRVFPLPSEGWMPGEFGVPNVLESITLENQRIVAPVLAAMKAGRRLTVSWGGGGLWDGDGMLQGDQTTFSLNGLTAALEAIERHLEGGAR